MPYRRTPQSLSARLGALKDVSLKIKIVGEENVFLSTDVLKRLFSLSTIIDKELTEQDEAYGVQANASKQKIIAQTNLEKHISHFIQVFNMGSDRGVYQAGDRKMYHLEVENDTLPKLSSENDLTHWGKRIIQGDKKRMTHKGRLAMVNPSADDVNKALAQFEDAKFSQESAKGEATKEHHEVIDLIPEIDDLIRDIWDEVEFHFRKEPSQEKRRLAREWGVVYVSRTGDVIEEDDKNTPQNISQEQLN